MADFSETYSLEQWCESLVDAGDPYSAEIFAKSIALDNSSKSLIMLSKYQNANGNADDALTSLDKAFNFASNSDERTDCAIMHAEILAQQSQPIKALKVLQEAENNSLELSPKVRDCLAYAIYSVLIELRDFKQAESLLERTFSISTADIAATTSDVFWQQDKSQTRIARDNTQISQDVLINTLKDKKPRFTYVVSGGLSECRHFANKVAQQLYTLTGAEAHLHIHGVIAGEEDLGNSLSGWMALKGKLERSTQTKTLTFTLNKFNLENLMPEQIEVVRNCAIYAALPDLMKDYNCPLILSKPDCLPMLNPAKEIDTNTDVQILQTVGSALDILSRISPSLLYLNPTLKAQRFATALRDYITPFFSEPEKIFPGLEQAALVSRHSKDMDSKIKMLPSSIIERNPANHSPWKFYGGTASYIQTGKQQPSSGFAHFLNKNKADFSLPILARAMGTNGYENEAISILDLHLAESKKKRGPEKFELLQLKALLQAHIGDLKASQNTLKMAQDQLSSNKHYKAAKNISRYQLASVSAAIGDITEAQEIFNKHIEIDCDNGWLTHTGIINLEHTDSNFDDTPELTIEGDIPSPELLEYLYLVSADAIYCKQFATALIKSISELSPIGCHLHIHGLSMNIDTDDNESDGWDYIRDQLANLPISNSFSHRKLDIKKIDRRQEKVVYASERFRILPQLLDIFQCPVIVADIDQLPLGNPGDVIDAKADVQLLRHPKSVLNFLSVTSATLSVFHPTESGKAFSRSLASYLSTAYVGKNSLDWHLDQAALTALSYTAPSDTTISFLDPALVMTNPHESSPQDAADNGALFWSITNSISGNITALHLLDSCADVN